MDVLKKITFYYNRDRYEAFSYVVKVDSKMSDLEIAKKVIPGSDTVRIWDESTFYSPSDDITTEFEVVEADIIDLTKN